MSDETIGIGLIGSKFMGKAHSNAWLKVHRIFDLPRVPRMRAVAARDAATLEPFAQRWGWETWTTRWQDLVEDDAVDLVDIGGPNNLHAEQSIAALEAGKHVACEKPLAASLGQARAMARAAEQASVNTYVWYTYRRVPAVALAQRLVAAGALGRIYHVRAAYYQGWGGPTTPRTWRFDADQAGFGAHGDLAAHIVDMARFVTGEEITEVSGAIEARFIDERPLPDDPGRFAPSTVDDATAFIGRLDGGAIATFESTRLATGVKNSNRIEVHGERGALRFDFERMNELAVFDATDADDAQGWKTLLVTHENHPWAGSWWPDGHWLGYENTFVNQAADILSDLAGLEPEAALPDFADAYLTERVLHAAILSARQRRPVAPAELDAQAS